MKYTWPKRKLCRREQINLFGPSKYNVKKGEKVPGMHWATQPRLSEYWKLLRNKQVLKRMYFLTEKQFAKLVTKTSQRFAKNKSLSHDAVLMQFLESRCDAILLKSWVAQTIMQARQMLNHGHFTLNWVKHTIPSTMMQAGDVLEVRSALKESVLYKDGKSNASTVVPNWMKTDAAKQRVELIKTPEVDEKAYPVDVLKVIEFYARA